VRDNASATDGERPDKPSVSERNAELLAVICLYGSTGTADDSMSSSACGELLDMLASSSSCDGSAALVAMHRLCMCGGSAFRECIVEAGALPKLVRAVPSMPREGATLAAVVLMALVEHDRKLAADVIAAAGAAAGVATVLSAVAALLPLRSIISATPSALSLMAAACLASGDSSLQTTVTALAAMLSPGSSSSASAAVKALAAISGMQSRKHTSQGSTSDGIPPQARAALLGPAIDALLQLAGSGTPRKASEDAEELLDFLLDQCPGIAERSVGTLSSDWLVHRLASKADGQAAAALKDVAWKSLTSDAARRELVAAGVFKPLVALLRSELGATAKEATLVVLIRLVDGCGFGQSALAEEEWERPAAKLLASGRLNVATSATVLLNSMSSGQKDCDWSVVSDQSSAVSGLLRMVRSGCGEAEAAATVALARICRSPGDASPTPIRLIKTTPGVIVRLLGLLGSSNALVAESAVAVISSILRSDEAGRSALRDAGAVQRLLELASFGRGGVHVKAADISSMLGYIVDDETALLRMLVDTGLVPLLVWQLCSDVPDEASEAAATVEQLAAGSKALAGALVLAKAVGPLARLLSSDVQGQAAAAACSIASIAGVSPEAAQAVADEGALDALLMLLLTDAAAKDDDSPGAGAAAALTAVALQKPGLCDALMDHRAITVLSDRLTSPSSDVARSSAAALGAMVAGCGNAVATAAAAAGAGGRLAALLDRPDERCAAAAAAALGAMAGKGSSARLIEDGAVRKLTEALQQRRQTVADSAAWALSIACGADPACRALVFTGPAIRALVERSLRGPPSEASPSAAGLLCHVATSSPGGWDAVVTAGGRDLLPV